MKRIRANVMRLATCLTAGLLCQCELPDAEYFAQKWEEQKVVFDPPKWQLAQGQTSVTSLNEPEFPPLPYMSPELPLTEGGARLTPPVADSRSASLLPSLAETMSADRDFNVVQIPEWKQEEVKAAQPTQPADKTVLANLVDAAVPSLPVPPSPSSEESPASPLPAVIAKADTKPAETTVTSKAPPKSEAVGEASATKVASVGKPLEQPPKSAAGGEKEEPEKVKVAGGAPGLALMKPPVSATSGADLAAELEAKPATARMEGGGAQTEPMASAATVLPAGEILDGLPVPGRPGLVRSPYGQSHQLVDVSDLKAEDLIKCPFSGKVFRVPSMEPTSPVAAETVEKKAEQAK